MKVIDSFIKNTDIYMFLNKLRLKKELRNGRDYKNTKLFGDHNLDILFIHIPKAAGMSIVDSIYQKKTSNHASCMDYINEDKHRYKQMFSFAIVRNPYTRLYSAYQYLKKGGMGLVDEVWFELYVEPFTTFEDFVMNGGLESAINNKADHFKPQYQFVCNKNKEILCDYIGNFEDLSAVEIKVSLMLKKEIRFHKKNITNAFEIDIDRIYNKKMIDKVNLFYAEDFLLFNYKKL